MPSRQQLMGGFGVEINKRCASSVTRKHRASRGEQRWAERCIGALDRAQ
jgi:hypothetical protein